MISSVFSRWTIIDVADDYVAPNGVTHRKRWMCRCACGTEKIVDDRTLQKGLSKSCGCLRREVAIEKATVHGHATGKGPSPEYVSWSRMVSRCDDPKNNEYHRYGAQGIAVCERWRKFENFLSDMGARPKGMSIDRWPDKNGGYEPRNCRWATSKQQARNVRTNRLVEYRGKQMPLAEACELAGLNYKAVHCRINSLGWAVNRALNTPVAQCL